MTADEGSVLAGRYRLGRLLGRGGMADVYQATDEVLHRDVAVKVLRESTEDSSAKARFTDEGRTLAKLSHPSLVTVLDAGTDGDASFLVLQLVHGSTLAEVLRSGTLPFDRVSAIGCSVAAALAHVHDSGVVHRDVKPGNVLLTPEGDALLADFGIARLLADTSHHTRTGLTIGTAAYLSPEQVRGEAVTPATDVYSLALVLLEALTGRPVYEGPATEAALARLQRSPAIPMGLPGPARALLEAMTRIDPRSRPSASEVAAGLAVGSSGGFPDRTRVLPVQERPAGDVVPPRTTEAAADAATQRLSQPAQAPAQAPTQPPAQPFVHQPVIAPVPAPGAGRRQRGSQLLALVAGVLIAVMVLYAVLGRDSGTSEEDGADGSLPDGVPSQLQDPLADLHDAVEGTD